MKHILTTLTITALLSAGCMTQPHTNSQLRAPQNFIEHQFDDRKWKIGHQDGNQQDFISEWVLPGESVKGWTELLTAHIHFEDQDLSALLVVMREQLAQGSKDFQFTILEESPSTVAFEWGHKGSGKWPAQREIKRIMRGTDGIYALSYAVKETSFSDTYYSRWKENIMNAKLRNLATR